MQHSCIYDKFVVCCHEPTKSACTAMSYGRLAGPLKLTNILSVLTFLCFKQNAFITVSYISVSVSVYTVICDSDRMLSSVVAECLFLHRIVILPIIFSYSLSLLDVYPIYTEGANAPRTILVVY